MCRGRGILRREGVTPLVGDRVAITIQDEEEGVIDSVHERKNSFVRPAVANIDAFVCVIAAADPAPNPEILDRFLVTAEAANVPAIVCINKADLCSGGGVNSGERTSEVREIATESENITQCEGTGLTGNISKNTNYSQTKNAARNENVARGENITQCENAAQRKNITQKEDFTQRENAVGCEDIIQEIIRIYGNIYPVVITSTLTGEGMDDLKKLIVGKTVAFAGPSGVGKSSLVGLLTEGSPETGEISRKTGRGRHTTRHVEIFDTDFGARIFDTPGYSSFEGVSVDEEILAECFPEIWAAADGCRFDNCTHTEEPDCAVRAAVDSGKIAASRYDSYARMRERKV
jgi:ribosome biogenesis GTPase